MDIQRKETVNLKNNLPKEPAAPPKVQRLEAPARPYRRKNYGRLFSFVFVVILLGAGFAVYYFYRQAADLKQNATGDQAAQEAKDVINKVSRLMILPTDEEPTVATVSDPEKLKDQAFFANAKLGDKVLIFTQAKKAILYDPMIDKIVEVSPLNLATSTSTP